MSNMAIFKASYTKSRSGAKASIRYMQHRPGKEGAKITRTLFGCFDGSMERGEAYRMIDAAENGSLFFRFVLSPDAKTEDTERDLFLREITEQTMLSLEDRLHNQMQWVAVEHNDHSSHRHVHVVAIIPRRLQVQDLQSLRQTATDAALEQRRQRDLTLMHLAREREEEEWVQSV